MIALQSSVFTDDARAGWFWLICVALTILVVLQAGYILWMTHAQPVSFDGGMNLQVSASLADGKGYGRFYDHWRWFPEEVQTNAAYVLPAAWVFEFAGVSLTSAQWVSQAYLLVLIALVIWLVRPVAGTASALAAALLVLLTPMLARFGLNAYGEIPALCWSLLGLGLLYRAVRNEQSILILAAGACFSTAVLTKTVMLMPVGLMIATYLMLALLERRWFHWIWLSLGFVLVVFLHELWKLATLGSLAEWVAWWSEQYAAILPQTGLATGFADTPNRWEKFLVHSQALAGFLHLPVGILPLLLIAPVVTVLALTPGSDGNRDRLAARFVLASLLLCVLAYFTWWLLVTPTERAWHRRIINGLVLLAILVPLVVGYLSSVSMRWRLGLQSVMGLVALMLLTSAFRSFDWNGPDPMRKQAFSAAVDFMRNAPESARFYGHGWYSAPHFSLYSGRDIFDLSKRKFFLDMDRHEHYLLIDEPMLWTDDPRDALEGLTHETVLDAGRWAKIIRITNALEFQSFSQDELNAARPRVNFLSDNYGLVRGMFDPEGDGWRWVQPHSKILLRYDGEPALKLDGYIPSLDLFSLVEGSEMRIRASINGCDLGSKPIVVMGAFSLNWAMDDCDQIGHGPVEVEFQSNAFHPSVYRGLSWIVHAISFEQSSAE